MAKISELDPAETLAGDDPVVILQGGEAKQAAVSLMVGWVREGVEGLFETIASPNLYDPATMRVAGKFIANNGQIGTDAAWSYYRIPVTPGQTYAWASNTTRRVGSAFLDGAGVGIAPSTYDGTAATGGVSQSRVAPAGAAFLAINGKSNVIADPTQMMVNLGAAALPYEPWFEPYDVVADQASSRILSTAKSSVDASINGPWHNYMPFGDFVGGDPDIRSASAIADLAHSDLLDRGVDRGIRWRAGNDFLRYTAATSQQDIYCFGAFIVHSVDAANLMGGAKLFKETDAGAVSTISLHVEGYIALSATTRLVWATGRVDADVRRILLGTSVAPAVADTRFASDFTLFLAATPIDKDEAIRQVNLAAKARAPGRRWARALSSESPSAASRLILNGPDAVAYVESDRSGHLVRNTFTPFPTVDITDIPCRFAIADCYIDGDAVRTGVTDDTPPDHVYGAKTLGGIHGNLLGRCTAAAHGQTVAEEGQRVVLGGVNHVLVKVEDAATLLIAVEDANVAPAPGIYSHESGPAPDFTVTAVTPLDWFPPHTNYSLKTFVDGRPIAADAGSWSNWNDVHFVEVCDMLPRGEIIAWWKANGGASGGLMPDGNPDYRLVTTYHFDRDAQLTVHRDWIALAPTPISDLMGIQIQRKNDPLTYRIPGGEPFAYDGDTLDYGMGVASGRTLTAAPIGDPPAIPSVNLDAAKLQATGEYAHRMIQEWAGHAFIAGLLPVGDAAYDVRRAQVANRAMEIRGNSAKVYFRVVDKGDFTADPGDSFSAVCFRHVVKREAGRPLVCPVRLSDRKAIVYIDWLDFAGFDQVAVNAPDLIGRIVTVLDSRNATLVGGALATGSVTADVDAEGDHAYLVLEIAD